MTYAYTEEKKKKIVTEKKIPFTHIGQPENRENKNNIISIK